MKEMPTSVLAPPKTTGLRFRGSYAWYITGLFSFCYFVAYLDRAIINLLIENIKADLSLSDTQISILVGVSFALFFALAGIPLGRLADSSNRKRIIAGSIFVWGVATMASGLARGFWPLFTARMIVGCGEAGLSPAAMSIISDKFEPKRRHMAITTYLIGGIFGGGLASVIGVFLLTMGERLAVVELPVVGALSPWQWVFILVGLPSLPLTAVVMLTVKEPVRKDALDHTVRYEEVLAYIRRNWKTYVAIIFGVTFITIVNIGYLSWGIPLFVRVHGIDVKQAAFLFFIPTFFAGFVGNYLVVWFGKYLTEKRNHRAGLIFAGQIIAGAVLVPMAVGPLIPNAVATVAVLAPAIGVMIGCSVLASVSFQIIVPNQFRGISIALFNLVNTVVAAGFGPVIVALLTDYVFRNESMVHYSTATMAVIFLPIAFLLLRWGRVHFTRTYDETEQSLSGVNVKP